MDERVFKKKQSPSLVPPSAKSKPQATIPPIYSLEDQILYLQRTVGNQAVQRLLAKGQTAAPSVVKSPQSDLIQRQGDEEQPATNQIPETPETKEGAALLRTFLAKGVFGDYKGKGKDDKRSCKELLDTWLQTHVFAPLNSSEPNADAT